MKSIEVLTVPNIGDDPYFAVRNELVERINRERSAVGVGPVEFDPLSSAVGDRHCQEMAGHAYLSHWNLQGLLPYHRYNFAGGRDHVQENLSRMTVASVAANPISAEPQAVLQHLMDAHQRYVSEQPPLDGHRRNVYDPGHTHVGIGLAVAGREFTMAEEFVNRYVELASLPEILPKRAIAIQGKVLRSGFGPLYCALFYEGWPRARSIGELNQTYAYEDMTGTVCARVPPWQMSFEPKTGRFRFNVTVNPQGPGYYHFVLWVQQPVRAVPYGLRLGENQVNTKDGVLCADWIFRTA
jgi:hypothetical protein